MEEHPVALAIYILSPNSWESVFHKESRRILRERRENSSRGLKLAALNGVLFELSQNLFLNRQGLTKVKDSLLAKVSLKAFHNQSLVA